jgi:large repetitive protein
MKKRLLKAFTVVVLFLIPLLNFGQAPNLGVASNFALFTAVGAINNSGLTTITGDIGTNVGAFNLTGATIIGSSHVADAVSAQAATDVDLAYGSISPITCGSVIGTTLGSGQTLLPNVYCLGAASTINGDLTLDGQGDPNSLFIFKIDGALATSVGSRILLTNSASLCNVYFQVNGEVTLGENSLFQGILLVNGAIHLLNNATLIGRGLSRTGAINLSANAVNAESLPVASVISANGVTVFCKGDSIELTGNLGGTWNTGETTSSIIVKSSGDYFVTNSNGCGDVASNHIVVTVLCIAEKNIPVGSIALQGPTESYVGDGSVIKVVISAAGFAPPYDFYYEDIITSVGPDCLPRAVGGTFTALNEADSTVVLTYTGASAGAYTITLNRVVDANGCKDTTRRSVTFTIVTKPGSTPVRPKVLVNCLACVSQVNVSLDAKCRFLVTPNMVLDGFAQCENGEILKGALEVLISDGNNDSYINCVGTYSYVVRLKAEYAECFQFEPCWGKITAEDKTAPILVCAPANITLDCYDVNYLLNNKLTIGNVNAFKSPKPAATGAQTILYAEGVLKGTELGDNCTNTLTPPALTDDVVKNLGYAYFKDNCRDCGCRITLKWSDKVVYYSCEDLKTNGGIYATISRVWVATDCNGMRSAYTQKINFKRPAISAFKFNGTGSDNYDRVVTYNACTPDQSLIKYEDVTPFVDSYFYTSDNKRRIYIDKVECNYSVSIKDTEFPICGGKGVKIDRQLYVFDWCAGGIVDTFHILIKIGDFEAPSFSLAHHAPFEISTGPMDCTAAFPVTVAGIKSAFGVSITDNCGVANATVTVKTKDRYVKGILIAENTWDQVEYAIMNGMMIGVPVGTHRLIIDAFDGCYNAKRDSFTFAVKDKIAPIMKCDDQLHISLSNGNGYTTGYAQVTAADIDEGSWDNCKLAWIAVRRNIPTGCAASFIAKGYDTNGNGILDPLPVDGDWTKADGFDRNGDGTLADFGETFILKGGKLMTPLQDNVEFFCCDLTALVTVELWGADSYGNTNFCWDELLIEDKVAPTCVAPWPLTIDCDDKCLEKIDDKKASALCFGEVTITSGNDCGALDTVYTVEKSLRCGYGTIVRKWALTKQTAKGPITINCSQTITVNPIHEYDICFPKDAIADCKTPIVDTIITDELGCDILSVNVLDKRYDASDNECYKIFRTYSVINWCTYDDRCGDPLEQTKVSIINRAVFGNYGKAPIYVLVRDENRDGDEAFYLSQDLIANNADDVDFTAEVPFCKVAGEYYHSFIYTQIIKVYDETPPVVTGTPAKFCIREGADCLANLKMVINGKDNCSDKVTLETQFLMIAPYQTLDASKMIMYSTPKWSTKNLGNGDFEINVQDLVPLGKHDLIVVIRDECGNLSVPTRIPFTVEDCKGPAPICINGLSTDLMSDGNNGGMMAVWATDFVASKIYDCNGQDASKGDPSGRPLITKYSLNRIGFPKDKNVTGINLTCADKGKVILVELHAWDEAGNDDFCVTYVEVQDNNKVCPGSTTNTANIAGTISTEGADKLQGASITLSGSASQAASTSATGGYSFVNLATGSDFTVTPQLDKNHLNGVSTFDLVLIQKHILGIQALNSPYKLIAADVNNSKSISTLDMIQLRKLILNIDPTFQNNTSWRFVDAAYRFPDSNKPWSTDFPEVVSINDFATSVTANFVAIKVGDVNASALVSSANSTEVRSSGTFKLNTTEQSLKAGNEYQVVFSAADLPNIQGYQFALSLDLSKVELLDIEYGVAKAENFGVFKNEGLITTSWNGKYEPGALFTLVLRAKAEAKLSSVLSLNRRVSPEAYNQHNENLGIALNYGLEAIADGYELLQNTPNPFSSETQIGFKLPKATKATLSVSDAKGALLYKVEGDYAKGKNQLTLKKAQLGASGVLYYTLETNDFTATKKMIVFE